MSRVWILTGWRGGYNSEIATSKVFLDEEKAKDTLKKLEVIQSVYSRKLSSTGWDGVTPMGEFYQKLHEKLEGEMAAEHAALGFEEDIGAHDFWELAEAELVT